MRLAIQYIRHENQPIETVALRLGAALWRHLAGRLSASLDMRRARCGKPAGTPEESDGQAIDNAKRIVFV